MPFLYTSCVLDCALRFLMTFLPQKKKKNQIATFYCTKLGLEKAYDHVNGIFCCID
jgi:hypothetical protein